MSWIDVAALTLTLWSGAKGYLHGAYHAFFQLLGLLVSLVVAVIMQKPLTAYLNGEWQAESYFVAWLTRNGELFTSTGASQGLELPPLAGTVMHRLVPSAQVVPVFGQGIGLAVIGAMVIRFFALTVFFILLATVIALILRIKQHQLHQENLAEWKKMLGLLFGLCYGLGLALVLCVALDALSALPVFLFLQHDLSISYLAKITARVLSLL